jgi:metal-responsive CopG/Arc/MetJ family transcriptional regulator
MSKTRKDKPTTLTVHLPLKRELLKRLDAMAEDEKRSRVNLISILLEKVMAQEVSL